jgi:hypothetical protein
VCAHRAEWAERGGQGAAGKGGGTKLTCLKAAPVTHAMSRGAHGVPPARRSGNEVDTIAYSCINPRCSAAYRAATDFEPGTGSGCALAVDGAFGSIGLIVSAASASCVCRHGLRDQDQEGGLWGHEELSGSKEDFKMMEGGCILALAFGFRIDHTSLGKSVRSDVRWVESSTGLQNKEVSPRKRKKKGHITL